MLLFLQRFAHFLVGFVFYLVAQNLFQKVLDSDDSDDTIVFFDRDKVGLRGDKLAEHGVECRHAPDRFGRVEMELTDFQWFAIEVKVYEVLHEQYAKANGLRGVEDGYTAVAGLFDFVDLVSIYSVCRRQPSDVFHRSHDASDTFFTELESAFDDFDLILVELTFFITSKVLIYEQTKFMSGV